jgi:hypothetical protein
MSYYFVVDVRSIYRSLEGCQQRALTRGWDKHARGRGGFKLIIHSAIPKALKAKLPGCSNTPLIENKRRFFFGVESESPEYYISKNSRKVIPGDQYAERLTG